MGRNFRKVAVVLGVSALAAAFFTGEPASDAQGKIVPVVCLPSSGPGKTGFFCAPNWTCVTVTAGVAYQCVSAGGGKVAAARFTACDSERCCDDGLFCNGRERFMPGGPGSDYRGCVAAAGPACGANQACNEQTDSCVSNCADNDRDGHGDVRCGGDDCDDNDRNRYPGNPEVCDTNGHDEDCNPCTIASDSLADGDADRDGYLSRSCSNPFTGAAPRCNPATTFVDAAAQRVMGRDCDDGNAAIVPGAMTCGPRGVLVCPAVGPAATGAAPVNGWYERACASGTSCLKQPNGTGVCAR